MADGVQLGVRLRLNVALEVAERVAVGGVQVSE